MLRPSRVRREVCSGHRLRLRDVQRYSLLLSIIKSRWRALRHCVREFSRWLSVPRCAVFTTLRTGAFSYGLQNRRRDQSRRTVLFRCVSGRPRLTACSLLFHQRSPAGGQTGPGRVWPGTRPGGPGLRWSQEESWSWLGLAGAAVYCTVYCTVL